MHVSFRGMQFASRSKVEVKVKFKISFSPGAEWSMMEPGLPSAAKSPMKPKSHSKWLCFQNGHARRSITLLIYVMFISVTPLDVVKTRLQSQQKPPPRGSCLIYYNGLMDHMCPVHGNGNGFNGNGIKQSARYDWLRVLYKQCYALF